MKRAGNKLGLPVSCQEPGAGGRVGVGVLGDGPGIDPDRLTLIGAKAPDILWVTETLVCKRFYIIQRKRSRDRITRRSYKYFHIYLF